MYVIYENGLSEYHKMDIKSMACTAQDRRIAHMPYHALTPAEREMFNARRRLLAHMGDILRMKAVERERVRLEEEDRIGMRSEFEPP